LRYCGRLTGLAGHEASATEEDVYDVVDRCKRGNGWEAREAILVVSIYGLKVTDTAGSEPPLHREQLFAIASINTVVDVDCIHMVIRCGDPEGPPGSFSAMVFDLPYGRAPKTISSLISQQMEEAFREVHPLRAKEAAAAVGPQDDEPLPPPVAPRPVADPSAAVLPAREQDKPTTTTAVALATATVAVAEQPPEDKVTLPAACKIGCMSTILIPCTLH